MSTIKVNNLVPPNTGETVAINGLNMPTAGALSNRNLLINADMRIDQRNSGSSIALGLSTYPVDRWIVRENTDGTATGQRVTDTPNDEFTYSLKYTVGTADSSLAATQYGDLQQRIEGNNSAFLGWGTSGAKSITISFWVKSSVTGTYYVGVHNNAFNRSYPKSYTINSANTWEYKTLTIPGDTSGTWLTNNGTGIFVFWCVGTGSAYQATADQWNASGAIGASDQTNLLGTAGATFFLTGCQLEVGTKATPFEHRSYGDELARCQRYFFKPDCQGDAKQKMMGISYGSDTYYIPFELPVPMRTAPSVPTAPGASWRSRTTNSNILSGFTWNTHGPSSTTNVMLAITDSTTGGIGASTTFWLETHSSTGCSLEFNAEF